MPETEQHVETTPGFDMKKSISGESFIFFGLFLALFCFIGSKMGTINMLNTMMNTAHDLLMNTVFYLMAICVMAGALLP